MKRVLVLNHFAVPPGYPGGTRHIELFERLDGWAYRIVASRLNLTTGEPQRRYPGFTFVPVLPYAGNGLGRVLNWVSYAAVATATAMFQRRIDVVYASSPHLLSGLAGWLVSAIRRCPLILEVRDLWPEVLIDMNQLSIRSPVYKILKSLELFLYRKSTAVVVMATGSVSYLTKLGVAAHKIVYIPNAADPEDFLPSASRSALRERYGFQRMTALYAGAHGPANGLNLLLDAAHEVDDLNLDIVLIGAGVDKPALIDRVQRERLSNVRFLEPVAKAEIRDVLAAADIGLHVLADIPLFRYGVSPNKVFDCMAAGLPVITNSPGVVEDAVNAAGGGIAVAPYELGRALRQMATTPSEELERYRSDALEWSKANSRSEMSRRLLELLNAVSEASDSSYIRGPRKASA